jgi:hypothetical protein
MRVFAMIPRKTCASAPRMISLTRQWSLTRFWNQHLSPVQLEIEQPQRMDRRSTDRINLVGAYQAEDKTSEIVEPRRHHRAIVNRTTGDN